MDGLAKDQGKFDLIVQQLHVRGPRDVLARGCDRGVGLGEEHIERLFVRIESRFDHVPTVVRALAIDPAGLGDG